MKLKRVGAGFSGRTANPYLRSFTRFYAAWSEQTIVGQLCYLLKYEARDCCIYVGVGRAWNTDDFVWIKTDLHELPLTDHLFDIYQEDSDGEPTAPPPIGATMSCGCWREMGPNTLANAEFRCPHHGRPTTVRVFDTPEPHEAPAVQYEGTRWRKVCPKCFP